MKPQGDLKLGQKDETNDGEYSLDQLDEMAEAYLYGLKIAKDSKLKRVVEKHIRDTNKDAEELLTEKPESIDDLRKIKNKKVQEESEEG